MTNALVDYKKFALSSDVSSFKIEEGRGHFGTDIGSPLEIIEVGDGWVRVQHREAKTEIIVPMGWYGFQKGTGIGFESPNYKVFMTIQAEPFLEKDSNLEGIEKADMKGVILTYLPGRDIFLEIKDCALSPKGHRKWIQRTFIHHPYDDTFAYRVNSTMSCDLEEAPYYAGFYQLIMSGLKINWREIFMRCGPSWTTKEEFYRATGWFRNKVVELLCAQDRAAISNLMSSAMRRLKHDHVVERIIDDALEYFSDCDKINDTPDMASRYHNPDEYEGMIVVQTFTTNAGEKRSCELHLVWEKTGPALDYFIPDVRYEDGKIYYSGDPKWQK